MRRCPTLNSSPRLQAKLTLCLKSTVRLYLRALCNQTPPRSFLLALCLLIPLALLAASCGSNSDSTTPEDPDPQNPVTTEIAGEDSSDSTTPEVSTPRSTTSAQSEPPSGNTAENSNSGALPAASQQPQINQSKATAISAGGSHACALHQTGSISCWGSNRFGQLGDGTGGNEGDMSSVPVAVVGISDAIAVSASDYDSCALHQTGTISCWSYGWPDASLIPVEIDGIDDAIAVSVGSKRSCALHQNGTISCWSSSSVPVKVQGIDDATAVSAGDYDSCALRQNGTISCWSPTAGSVPEEIDGISDATAVDAGSSGTPGGNACALHQTGTISCWGPTYRSVPEEIDGITDATAITLGQFHSCALHQTGNISCWGSNWDGQLGSEAGEWERSEAGNTFESSVPIGVTGISDAAAITAGGGYSCALHQTGNISCWGANWDGQLGDGTNNYSSLQGKVQGIDDAVAISTGVGSSCALRNDGNISCWGSNSLGQLGNGTGGTFHAHSPVPVKVTGIDDATAITTGSFFDSNSCALHQNGTISCWGRNDFGQLGNDAGGNEGDMSSVPVKVQDIDNATAISAGWGNSCALHQNGTISCWGINLTAQIDDNEEPTNSVPVKVQDIDDATAISTGWGHSCALHQNGTISCWGRNEYGQLGDGSDEGSLVPVGVVGIDDATAISAGNLHTCALHRNGNISCWGYNLDGQLGDGTDSDLAKHSSVPVKVVNIDDATAIGTSWDHSCALHQNGTISCWGRNDFGQLGNDAGGNEGDMSSVPVKVQDIDNATAISTSSTNSCALHQNGTISCWGTNYRGALGDGTYVSSFLPRFVAGFGG